MPPARRLLRVAGVRPLLVIAAAIGVLATSNAAHASPSVDDLETQISTKSARLEKIVEQYNKAGEELKKTKADAAVLETSMKPLQDQLDAAQERVTAIAVQAYKGGRMANFSSVLEAGSAETAVDRLTTIDQLASSNQKEIDAYHAARSDQEARKTKLADLQKSQQKKVDDLAKQRKTINAELTHLNALKREAQAAGSSSSTSSGTSSSGSAPNVSGKAGVAVRFAYNALGTPYVWAGASSSGYDCSGLTMAAWAAAGYSLPHNAEMQYNQLPHVSRSQLKAGDLVFYSDLGHVAIYVGSGKVIHAPTFGEVVKVSSIDMMTPYGYARVA